MFSIIFAFNFVTDCWLNDCMYFVLKENWAALNKRLSDEGWSDEGLHGAYGQIFSQKNTERTKVCRKYN